MRHTQTRVGPAGACLGRKSSEELGLWMVFFFLLQHYTPQQGLWMVLFICTLEGQSALGPMLVGRIEVAETAVDIEGGASLLEWCSELTFDSV